MSRLNNMEAPRPLDDAAAVAAKEQEAGVKAQAAKSKADEGAAAAAMVKSDDKGLPLLAKEERAVDKAVTSRTYILRNGKSASFPIVFPNGQAVIVNFRNGSKTLTGRLMQLFHQEFIANAILRTKVAEVNTRTAEKVAEAYLAKKPVASTGFASAESESSLRDAQIHDAQMRRMQKLAAAGEGGTVDLVPPISRFNEAISETQE